MDFNQLSKILTNQDMSEQATSPESLSALLHDAANTLSAQQILNAWHDDGTAAGYIPFGPTTASSLTQGLPSAREIIENRPSYTGAADRRVPPSQNPNAAKVTDVQQASQYFNNINKFDPQAHNLPTMDEGERMKEFYRQHREIQKLKDLKDSWQKVYDKPEKQRKVDALIKRLREIPTDKGNYE